VRVACRDTQNDSCGFEHVFVGEVDEGHVKGLHNWLQTMVEEARGDLDYLGFVLPRRHTHMADGDDDLEGPRRLVSVQLGWEVRRCPQRCAAVTHSAHACRCCHAPRSCTPLLPALRCYHPPLSRTPLMHSSQHCSRGLPSLARLRACVCTVPLCTVPLCTVPLCTLYLCAPCACARTGRAMLAAHCPASLSSAAACTKFRPGGMQGEVKDVSTMFVGTSPEFELALYSLCFWAGEEVNRVSCGEYDLDIKCYRINSEHGDKVSSCFPVALE
jgi:Endoribonuclease XendoU